MIRNRMRVPFIAALALGAAASIGFQGLFHSHHAGGAPAGSTFVGVAPAAAAGAAVTPKTEAPNEARALSRAFSNVAKALAPAVVRIEVEVARGGNGNGGPNRRRMPAPNGPGDDDDDN